MTTESNPNPVPEAVQELVPMDSELADMAAWSIRRVLCLDLETLFPGEDRFQAVRWDIRTFLEDTYNWLCEHEPWGKRRPERIDY